MDINSIVNVNYTVNINEIKLSYDKNSYKILEKIDKIKETFRSIKL